MVGGDGGKSGGDGGGGTAARKPQSVQSVPIPHALYSAPAPPSSQKPSDGYRHASTHVGLLGIEGGGEDG